mgnify:CR=1 FL=1
MLTVYSKKNCPFCEQAKQLLRNKNINHEVLMIDEDPAAREWLIAQGHRTAPQIYQNGQLFVEGGYQGLSKLTEDQLKEKLSVTN